MSSVKFATQLQNRLWRPKWTYHILSLEELGQGMIDIRKNYQWKIITTLIITLCLFGIGYLGNRSHIIRRIRNFSTINFMISKSYISTALLPQSVKKAETYLERDLTPAAGLIFFVRNYIDLNYGGNGKPGWVRAGDMNNDGDLDIVVGGGDALFVYENSGSAEGWMRYGNLDSTGKMGANAAVLYDVDRDTDLDVVSAKKDGNLGWWKNPGGPLSNTPWTFHKLSGESWFLHDIILADLDQDGVAEEFVANLNQGYWDAKIKIKWFRPGTNPTQLWEAHTIESNRNEGPPHGHAGMDIGDVDRDGNVDLAYGNGWYEAPDDPAGTWTWHEVTDLYGISNTFLRDMDDDGDLDLIVSAGHHGYGVYWFAAPPDPITGSWTQNEIDSQVHHPECLEVLDLDDDNDLDIVTCDLFFGEALGEPDWNEEVHNVYVYKNLGSSTSWSKYNIAPNSYPSHLLQTVDINQDGLIDIISEGAGYSSVSYYEHLNLEPHIWLPIMQKSNTPF